MAKEQKTSMVWKPIKITMIVIFIIMGLGLIACGVLGLTRELRIRIDGTRIGQWIWIVILVFGVMLLTSPIFLGKGAKGVWWIIKIIFTIVFMIVGLGLIILNSLILSQNPTGDTWLLIVNIVFGALLFTSPIFLKK